MNFGPNHTYPLLRLSFVFLICICSLRECRNLLKNLQLQLVIILHPFIDLEAIEFFVLLCHKYDLFHQPAISLPYLTHSQKVQFYLFPESLTTTFQEYLGSWVWWTASHSWMMSKSIFCQDRKATSSRSMNFHAWNQESKNIDGRMERIFRRKCQYVQGTIP